MSCQGFDGLRPGRFHSIDSVRDSSKRNEFLLKNGADMGRRIVLRWTSSVPDFAVRTANNDPTQHCACLRVHHSHAGRLTSISSTSMHRDQATCALFPSRSFLLSSLISECYVPDPHCEHFEPKLSIHFRQCSGSIQEAYRGRPPFKPTIRQNPNLQFP